MKSLAFVAALATACLIVAPIGAAQPPPAAQTVAVQTEPAVGVPTIVEEPTPVSPLLVPKGGAGTLPTRPILGPIGSRLDCGACIVTCWGAETRSGSGDWSGHAYIYQHLSWCGNGAQVTYASVWQSYDQAGWYQVTAAYGPWWSSGCTGCGSIGASGYILWRWQTPFVSIDHYDTSWLNTTLYAWGGISV